MGRNQRGPRGCSPAHGECGQGGDVAELGPTEQPWGRVKEDGVKPSVVAPDGGIRDSSTNHSWGFSGALGTLQPWDGSPGGGESPSLGMAGLHRTQLQPSPFHASDGPAPVGTRDSGAVSWSRTCPQEAGCCHSTPSCSGGASCGGGWFPLPKLGHSRSSQALRAGSSSVKLQSLA